MPSSASLSPDLLLSSLQWRYAVKKFDSTRVIPAELWAALEKSLVLAPSSYGLQPWKFLVITRRELKEELQTHSFGQKQIVDASHLVVLAARKSIGEEDVDSHIQRTEEVRGPSDFLPQFRNRLVGDLVNGPRSAISGQWAVQQAYIALGQFLTAAAVLGVDACPMGGFAAREYDRILGLDQRGYQSVVLAAAGYRSPADTASAQPKVRFDAGQVIEHLS